VRRKEKERKVLSWITNVQVVYVHRKTVEERIDSVIAITNYAKHLKDAFYPYLLPTLNSLFKLLNYTWNEGMHSLRSSVAFDAFESEKGQFLQVI
jgi:hypothetical protein